MGSFQISIDIGASTIKMVEAKYEKQKIQVKNYSIIPTPRDSFENGTFKQPQAIIDMIKNEIQVKRYQAKELVLTLSSDAIINREVMLPKMSEKEVANVIQFEAEQYFPVNLENYKMDYKIIEETSEEDGNKLRLFVVAVPSEMIDSYVNIAEATGLNLKVLDLAGNTISKLGAMELKGTASKSIAMLELGATASRVVILDAGKMRFERMIKTGINNMTLIARDCLNVKLNEAEKHLIDKFAKYANVKNDDINLDKETKAIENGIKKLLNEFCDQVGKLLEFYSAHNAGKAIEKVYLTGGGARLAGIESYIAQALGINVELFAPKNCIEDRTAQRLNGNEAVFANALGALIRL